jgi:hypothetical protein
MHVFSTGIHQFLTTYLPPLDFYVSSHCQGRSSSPEYGTVTPLTYAAKVKESSPTTRHGGAWGERRYSSYSTGSGQGPVAGCCECGDEPSGSCATELVTYSVNSRDV